MDCRHENVRCLNHYETFRKYMCNDCSKVWMCECEKELALQFLPHQTRYGTEYSTHIQYAVSGFAQNICLACRGQKEEVHPRAAIYGQKGKIERYYWREIYKTYLEKVQDWLAERSVQVRDIIDFQNRFPKEALRIEKEAKKIWQIRHKKAPKYVLTEPSEASFLRRVNVPERYLQTKYIQIPKGKQKIGKWICKTGKPLTAEDVVAEWYENEGFSVRKCERKLISILVGTLCSSVIQDPKDPR